MNMMEFIRNFQQKHGVANRLRKRSLLVAVNLVAGLSIFFFGEHVPFERRRCRLTRILIRI